MRDPPPPPPPPFAGSVESGNGGETKPAAASSPIDIFMNIYNIITHVLLGVVALSAIMFANYFMSTTSLKQHIYLCVIGYFLLMSPAILSLSPHTGWTNSLKHDTKKKIHLAMLVLGSILAIAGSIIRMVDVPEKFVEPHGIMGLIAMIFTILSLIGGVGNFVFGNKLTKIIHAVSGSLTITMAFICLCLAFHNYYRSVDFDVNANILISLTVFALLGILMYPVINIIKRLIG